MDKFIEITTIEGVVCSINVSHVFAVSCERSNGDACTVIKVAARGYNNYPYQRFVTSMPYCEVMRLIGG